eukprot:m.199114 g.199114  ORF g.199114 m.199114 type:complete len:365 (-) comp18384_c0_seq4:65-1159(-)
MGLQASRLLQQLRLHPRASTAVAALVATTALVLVQRHQRQSRSSTATTRTVTISSEGGSAVGSTVKAAPPQGGKTEAAAIPAVPDGGDDKGEGQALPWNTSKRGIQAYEAQKAVNAYLTLHFCPLEDLIAFDCGLQFATEFTQRCAELCAEHALPRLDGKPRSAIDIGCAVGGTAFALAADFERVVGVDYSKAFVQAADQLKADGRMEYTITVEGDICEQREAVVPSHIDRSRVDFEVADACDLPSHLVGFDAVLAANLICRLPDPRVFLERLDTLVADNGIVVLISPFSWLSAWTDQDKWMGGVFNERGEPQWSSDGVEQFLTKDGRFELLHEENVPFVIRDHCRRYELSVSHGTVWRKVPKQ